MDTQEEDFDPVAFCEYYRDPYITYLGGRRIEGTSNRQHAKLRQLTLAQRKLYPSSMKYFKDGINSDNALAIFVAGAYRHVLDHTVFPDYIDEFRMNNGAVSLQVAKSWYNAHGSLNCHVSGFGNQEFYVPKKFYNHNGENVNGLKLLFGDTVTLRGGKVVDYGIMQPGSKYSMLY